MGSFEEKFILYSGSTSSGDEVLIKYKKIIISDKI
jgi:hypothetical protein